MAAPISSQKSPEPGQSFVESFAFPDPRGLIREVISLTENDLLMLEVSGPEHTPSENLRHIRAYHHVMALKLASGERASHVASAMGFTVSTVSQLQSSPQFQELVESYRERVIQKALDHVGMMDLVGAEALSAIHERLIDEEQRGAMSTKMLHELAEFAVDRLGHSPVRRSESSNVHRVVLSADKISRIKELHSEHNAWNDPTGAIAAEAVHQDAARSAGAAEDLASVFLSPQENSDNRKEGSGESL